MFERAPRQTVTILAYKGKVGMCTWCVVVPVFLPTWTSYTGWRIPSNCSSNSVNRVMGGVWWICGPDIRGNFHFAAYLQSRKIWLPKWSAREGGSICCTEYPSNLGLTTIDLEYSRNLQFPPSLGQPKGCSFTWIFPECSPSYNR